MAKRRGHGEGSVFRRSDGRWVGAADLGWEDGRRRRKYVYAATQGEVIEKLTRLRASLAAGLPPPSDRLTVEQLLEQWLDGLPDELSPNTVDNYTWAVRAHLVPALGRKRVRDLTPSDVAGFLNRKAGEGLGRSSRMRLRSVLVKAIRQAEVDGLVHRNVAMLVKAPSTAPGEGRSLTVEEARELLTAVRVHRLGAAFVVALTMGLRPGEVLGLAWDNVEFENQVLHVRESLKRERGGLRVGGLKTPRSRRSLAIPPVALTSLRDHRRRQAAERLRAGPMWTDSGLVFTSQVGTAVDPSKFRRILSKATSEIGLGHWSPNELRQSAVSLLSAAGVSLEEIADVVGHDGARMTSSVYRHLLNPVVATQVEPMQRLLGDADAT